MVQDGGETKMVELSKEIIDFMKDLKDLCSKHPFELNRFEVGTTGAGGEMISLDIRRHEK